MGTTLTDENGLSGRFQVRVTPVLHRKIQEAALRLNCSMNDVVETAMLYCLDDNREGFLDFADVFNNGAVMIVDNHVPIAQIVRRNLISFSRLGSDKLALNIKVRRGSVWKRAVVYAFIDQNPTLMDRLIKWSATEVL